MACVRHAKRLTRNSVLLNLEMRRSCPFSRTPYQDCVSCKTLSDCFHSDRLVVALFHDEREDEETQSESSEGSIESCAEPTNKKPLQQILVWDSVDPMHDHTFIPAENHISRPGKHASADLIRAKQWLESCRSNHASDDASGRTCTVQK